MSNAERRARKQANKAQAREERYASWRSHRRRRWAARGLIVLLVVALAGGGAFALLGGDDGVDAPTDTTVALPTTMPATDAAGMPCVAPSGELPPGAPAVPVQEGPSPEELLIEDLKEGDGAEVSEGDTVTIHYIGVSCSTGEVFDSSYARGEPATFPLGQLIPGWQQGIPGMRVGGQRLLGIPSDLGYGPTGQPPTIRPNEALWFVVEAVDTQTA